MELYTRDSLDQLKESADPVSCYYYVATNRGLIGRQCPFCKEKDMFNLNFKTGIFCCDQCVFKGDSLMLFMNAFRLSFTDAIKELSLLFDVEMKRCERKKKVMS